MCIMHPDTCAAWVHLGRTYPNKHKYRRAAKDATYRLMCPAPKRPQPQELPQEVRCETFVMGAGTSGPKGAWAGFVHESQVPGMLTFLVAAKAAPPTTQQAAAAAGPAAAGEFWQDPRHLDKIVAAVHQANPGHKGFWTRLLQDAFPASSGVSGARVIADARERVNTAVATLSGTTAHTAEEIATEMRLTTVQLDETAPAGHRLVAKMDKAALVKCVQHALQYRCICICAVACSLLYLCWGCCYCHGACQRLKYTGHVYSQVSVFSRVGFDEKQLLFLWTTGYTTGETFPASKQVSHKKKTRRQKGAQTKTQNKVQKKKASSTLLCLMRDNNTDRCRPSSGRQPRSHGPGASTEECLEYYKVHCGGAWSPLACPLPRQRYEAAA